MIQLRPVDPTQAVELDFLTALNRVVRSLVNGARAALLPAVAHEIAALKSRDEAGANARSVVELLRRQAEAEAARAGIAAREAVAREAVRHTRRWVASVEAGTGIDLAALLRDDDLVDVLSVRSEEFNALIRNLSADVLHRIERETLGAILEGRGNEEIAWALQTVAGIGRNRARLIARDQASKLNGAMNQFRQEQAGVTHYKWRTVLDGRERATHHARNGKMFAWSKPPSDGHPGRAINCRCRALPVLVADPDTDGPTFTEGSDLSGFAADNLPAIRSIAQIPSRGIRGMSLPEIGERLEQTQDLMQKVGGLKGATEFTEANAETLVSEFYGFIPGDRDLDGLAGSRVAAFVQSRRTKLIRAVVARLEMIRSLLQSAEIQARNAP